MKRDGAAGFTLIELMVVVAVIAILAAVGYPTYQDHIRKAKRAEGKAALLKAAQVLERAYSGSDPSTYVTNLVPLFAATTAVVYSGENPSDTKGSYTISVAAATANCPLAACFLLVAKPNAPFTDTTCGDFTITSTGTRCWSQTDPPDPAVVMTCNPTPANAGTCKW